MRTVDRNPWIPHPPHPKQRQFLLLSDVREALYGGAAGGGKSDGLLMAATQYADVPGYSALLLRKSFPDLMQPDALIPRSKEWWAGRADWNAQNKRWTFPSGATLSFGYLERDDDVFQYQGAAYQFIGFDELTQHTEARYRYLFSRLRRRAGVEVPLRMRSGSNPGGIGHDWVKRRFITHRTGDCIFVPARLADNPSLDAAEYERSLDYLDPITRAQLLAGDWEAFQGGRFKREWLRWRWERYGTGWKLGDQYVDLCDCWLFLTVDPAASVESTADYTVISVWAVSPRHDLIWLDCVRLRLEIPDIVPAIEAVYKRHQVLDGRNRGLLKFAAIEAVASNCAVYQAARRTRMTVRRLSPESKDKLVRATGALNLAASGKLWLPAGAPWLEEAEAELLRFTGDDKLDAHDDIVDTVAYAAIVLSDYNEHDIKGAAPGVVPAK